MSIPPLRKGGHTSGNPREKNKKETDCVEITENNHTQDNHTQDNYDVDNHEENDSSEKLLRRVTRRLASLPELHMRAVVLSEKLIDLKVGNAAGFLHSLLTGRQGEITGRKESLTALAELLAAELLPYEFLSQLYAYARENQMEVLAVTLFGVGSEISKKKKSEEPPKEIQPRGRELTLGERKALARSPDRNLLARLTADGDARVIEVVLSNPRIVETQVVRMAARRPAQGDILEVIARHKRWVIKPLVRRTLILNPHTPLKTSLRLLSLLNRRDLEDVTQAADLNPRVISAALRILKTKKMKK